MKAPRISDNHCLDSLVYETEAHSPPRMMSSFCVGRVIWSISLQKIFGSVQVQSSIWRSSVTVMPTSCDEMRTYANLIYLHST